MTKEEIQSILEEIKDISNLPNSKLVEMMDKLSIEFEITKQNIIDLTFYFDNIELLYNKIYEEYQNRNK